MTDQSNISSSYVKVKLSNCNLNKKFQKNAKTKVGSLNVSRQSIKTVNTNNKKDQTRISTNPFDAFNEFNIQYSNKNEDLLRENLNFDYKKLQSEVIIKTIIEDISKINFNNYALYNIEFNNIDQNKIIYSLMNNKSINNKQTLKYVFYYNPFFYTSNVLNQFKEKKKFDELKLNFSKINDSNNNYLKKILLNYDEELYRNNSTQEILALNKKYNENQSEKKETDKTSIYVSNSITQKSLDNEASMEKMKENNLHLYLVNCVNNTIAYLEKDVNLISVGVFREDNNSKVVSTSKNDDFNNVFTTSPNNMNINNKDNDSKCFSKSNIQNTSKVSNTHELNPNMIVNESNISSNALFYPQTFINLLIFNLEQTIILTRENQDQMLYGLMILLYFTLKKYYLIILSKKPQFLKETFITLMDLLKSQDNLIKLSQDNICLNFYLECILLFTYSEKEAILLEKESLILILKEINSDNPMNVKQTIFNIFLCCGDKGILVLLEIINFIHTNKNYVTEKNEKLFNTLVNLMSTSAFFIKTFLIKSVISEFDAIDREFKNDVLKLIGKFFTLINVEDEDILNFLFICFCDKNLDKDLVAELIVNAQRKDVLIAIVNEYYYIHNVATKSDLNLIDNDKSSKDLLSNIRRMMFKYNLELESISSMIKAMGNQSFMKPEYLDVKINNLTKSEISTNNSILFPFNKVNSNITKLFNFNLINMSKQNKNIKDLDTLNLSNIKQKESFSNENEYKLDINLLLINKEKLIEILVKYYNLKVYDDIIAKNSKDSYVEESSPLYIIKQGKESTFLDTMNFLMKKLTNKNFSKALYIKHRESNESIKIDSKIIFANHYEINKLTPLSSETSSFLISMLNHILLNLKTNSYKTNNHSFNKVLFIALLEALSYKSMSNNQSAYSLIDDSLAFFFSFYTSHNNYISNEPYVKNSLINNEIIYKVIEAYSNFYDLISFKSAMLIINILKTNINNFKLRQMCLITFKKIKQQRTISDDSLFKKVIQELVSLLLLKQTENKNIIIDILINLGELAESALLEILKSNIKINSSLCSIIIENIIGINENSSNIEFFCEFLYENFQTSTFINIKIGCLKTLIALYLRRFVNDMSIEDKKDKISYEKYILLRNYELSNLSLLSLVDNISYQEKPEYTNNSNKNKTSTLYDKYNKFGNYKGNTDSKIVDFKFKSKNYYSSLKWGLYKIKSNYTENLYIEDKANQTKIVLTKYINITDYLKPERMGKLFISGLSYQNDVSNFCIFGLILLNNQADEFVLSTLSKQIDYSLLTRGFDKQKFANSIKLQDSNMNLISKCIRYLGIFGCQYIKVIIDTFILMLAYIDRGNEKNTISIIKECYIHINNIIKIILKHKFKETSLSEEDEFCFKGNFSIRDSLDANSKLKASSLNENYKLNQESLSERQISICKLIDKEGSFVKGKLISILNYIRFFHRFIWLLQRNIK